jgi:hypothetical protein
MTMEEIRKTVTESRPMRAAVGATDLAVERAKEVWEKASAPEAKDQAKERLSRMQKSIGDAVTGFDPKAFREKVTETLDPKALQSTASRLPGWTVSGAIQVAGKAEARYESLAERGKELLEKAKNDPHAKDLVDQGKQAVDRTKTAVVTVRKKVDDRPSAARTAMGRGRDATSPVPESSAPAGTTEEETPASVPADTQSKAEPPVAPSVPAETPAETPAGEATSSDKAPEETPVATPPKKPASPRKRTSSTSTTARSKSASAKKAPAKKTAAKKTTTSRSSTGSAGSSASANGRKRTTPPPAADAK